MFSLSHTSPLLSLENFFSRMISQSANRNINKPWPQSPNITAKRKGKVVTVNNAEKNKYQVLDAFVRIAITIRSAVCI